MDSNLVMIIIWFAVIVIFFAIEAATFNLVTIWFGVAAILPLIMAILKLSIISQVIVFILLSIILLLLTRPLVKKLEAGKKVKTNYEAVIGKEGIAIDSFDVGFNGNVKVDGLEWLAFSSIDNITKGERVIVKEVTGSKIKVVKKH